MKQHWNPHPSLPPHRTRPGRWLGGLVEVRARGARTDQPLALLKTAALLVLGALSGPATRAPAQSGPPQVLTQPATLTRAVGQTATFEVLATGQGPLHYQWWRVSGEWSWNLAGATNATLSLPDLAPADAAGYRAVVSNDQGSNTTDIAVLTLIPLVHATPWPWLRAHGLMGDAVAAELADADGDGVPNWQEYLASTDPNDRQSALRLRIGVTNSDLVQLSFQAGVGRLFQLEVSEDLWKWSPLGAPILGAGQMVEVPALALLDQSRTRMYRLRALGDGLRPGMVWVPSGSFLMGSPDSEPGRSQNEGPQTTVSLSQDFWVSRQEVTQGEYGALMGYNPSGFQSDSNLPVENVVWPEATNYCARLTAQETAAGRLPAGYEYRLPTEAQWEYVCRAGSGSATAFGPALSSAQADFDGSAPYGEAEPGPNRQTTMRVGSFAANRWEMVDFHGNVSEWCADCYTNRLPGGSVVDPQGPPTGPERVVRGGNWRSAGVDCRSARRVGANGWSPNVGLGFRVVLVATRAAPGRGSVEGTLKLRSDGSPVAGVKMLLVNTDLLPTATNQLNGNAAVVATSVTDSSGRYLFASLPPGNYGVGADPASASLPGPVAHDASSDPFTFSLLNQARVVNFAVEDDPLFESDDTITVTINLDPAPTYKSENGYLNGRNLYTRTFDVVLTGVQGQAQFWIPTPMECIRRPLASTIDHPGNTLVFSFPRYSPNWLGFGALNRWFLNFDTLALNDDAAGPPNGPDLRWTQYIAVRHSLSQREIWLRTDCKRNQVFKYSENNDLEFVREYD